MRGWTVLLALALLCGLCSSEVHKARHMQTVYSWSAIDFVFPNEEARNTSLHDHTFVPGTAIPWGMDVDPHTGKMFMSFVKMTNGGIPASLATVSETTNSKGEHFLEPYPDWSWHIKGCEGMMSVEKMEIDECGRLWVMDSGTTFSEGISYSPKHECPAKILVFDLKTNALIKKHVFPESFIDNDSIFSTIVVEVDNTDNECKDTFAYVADTGDYKIVVYDMAKDESWMVHATGMYPNPDYGHFKMDGVEFDYMYGIYSMAMTPKHGDHGHTLYFNSYSSGKETHVKTSVLKHKENFEGYNHVEKEFITYPHPRPGGQTGSEAMDTHGVMFFNSLNDMSIYCWNHKSDYTAEHMAIVDSDDHDFQMFADVKVVKKDGMEELYILTNRFHKFMFGFPGTDEVLFRVMKAPVQELIAGTVCEVHHE